MGAEDLAKAVQQALASAKTPQLLLPQTCKSIKRP
jgi:hypothetical protein